MEKFVVSARKYRPQNFSTVVGQSHITTTLKNAINNNQLAHAFLFCGPRGVGKTTCARILAKTINCENRTEDGEACNSCNSCISFDNGTSLNIHELDAASNNSVEDIRSLVDQVRFAPQAGDYKVYIVDEVHMLSTAAFNAFLKTLEEPPSYAIFILATTEKHKILPTILSRCQIFDFKRITIQDTVDHLKEITDKEDIEADKASLHLISQKSEGCMRDALSILDKIASFTGGKITYSNTLEHLNILDEDYFFKLLEMMQKQQLSDALLLYDQINQKGFEGETLIDGLIEFIRNLFVSKDPRAAVLLEVADDFREKYIQVAGQVSSSWMISALNILTESSIAYKQSRNKRLFVEMILIKLSYLQQAVEISSSASEGNKKKTDVKPVAFRSLTPLKITEKEITREKKTEASLVIEKNLVAPQIPSTLNEDPVLKTPAPEENKKSSPLSSLAKIRAQVAERNRSADGPRDLTNESLDEAFAQFTQKLAEVKNHTVANTLKAIRLEITDNNSFNIITASTLQQKIIESERSGLIHHVQTYFNNKLLKYTIVVDETETDEKPQEKQLSRKEQYLLMIAQYPNVDKLRNSLRLELD